MSGWNGLRIHVAGTDTKAESFYEHKFPYVLESFEYIEDWQVAYAKSDHCKQFMLDSGAFTFMQDASGSEDIDWDDYVDDYVQFINRHDFDYFFELDIDSLVGLGRVHELRNRLERGTGKDCIPVWHKNRGKDAWLDLVRDYDYVAIGGIAGGEITSGEFKVLPWFTEKAHEHDCKVHALGFTPLEDPEQYGFDSSDSTSWLFNGSLNGKMVVFDGQEMQDYYRPDDHRMVDPDEIDEHNLRQWKRFVQYHSDETLN
jgi:hypothetical protein